MNEKIIIVNQIKENSNIKLDKKNDNTKVFNRLQKLQTLIKKQSSLKELCKNHK